MAVSKIAVQVQTPPMPKPLRSAGTFFSFAPIPARRNLQFAFLAGKFTKGSALVLVPRFRVV
jgi:hypothetical protein